MRAVFIILVVLLASAATACQGGPTDTPQERATTEATPSPSPTPHPTPTVEPAPAEQSTPRPTAAPVLNDPRTQIQRPQEPTADRLGCTASQQTGWVTTATASQRQNRLGCTASQRQNRLGCTASQRQNPAGLHGQPTDEPNAAPDTTPLTPEQQDCLPEEIREGRSILEMLNPHEAGIMSQAIACLTDEDITRFLILPGITLGESLPQEQADCIVQPETGAMMRSSLELSGDLIALDAALFSVIAHITLTAAACVPPEQFHKLFLPGTPLDRLKCIVPTAKDAIALFDETLQEGDQPLELAIVQAQPCLLQHPPVMLIEPLPDCTDEQRERGLPCLVD